MRIRSSPYSKSRPGNAQAVIERFIRDELLLGDEQTQIDPNEPLIASRVLDSLSVLRLITFLEERFNVIFEDDELFPHHFETINGIKALVESKQASF